MKKGIRKSVVGLLSVLTLTVAIGCEGGYVKEMMVDQLYGAGIAILDSLAQQAVSAITSGLMTATTSATG